MSKSESVEKNEVEELVPQDDAVIGRALKISLVIVLFGVAIACGVIFWALQPPSEKAAQVTIQPGAGKRAAAIMSLVHSARLNGHDPYGYLRDVLERLPTHPASRIGELLPHHWTPALIPS